MNGDIQLIADDYGLMVLGDSTDITQFLKEQGLESRDVNIKASQVASLFGASLDAAANIAQLSGRWVQLSEESVGKSNTTGLFTGVIGQGGYRGIKGNVQFVNAPGAVNPMMLSNVGTLMTQLALQQMMGQVTDYLKLI